MIPLYFSTQIGISTISAMVISVDSAMLAFHIHTLLEEFLLYIHALKYFPF